MGKSDNGRMPHKKVVERIANADQRELKRKLVYYADWQIRAKVWCGDPEGAPPAGKDAELFVDEALEKLLDGRCTCPADESVKLLQVLRGIVRSDIGTVVRGKENELTRRESYCLCKDEDVDSCQMVDLEDRDSDDPKAELERDEFRKQVLPKLSGDPLACGFVEHVLDRGTIEWTPAAIADALGVDVEEIYKVKRRLRRVFKNGFPK